MKKLLAFIFLTVLYFGYSYDEINLWDKQKLKDEKILFDSKNFILKDTKIPLKEVSYLSLNLSDNSIDIKTKFNLGDITPNDLIKRGEELERKYPDTSLLVLYDDGIQKLNKDGTRYSHSRYSIKILKENELSNSVLSFYYLKGDYETKIINAYSISKDSKISYLDQKDITYTPVGNKGLSFFSGRKDALILKATIPNVEVGSIIDYEWESVEKSPEDASQFYTNWYFGGDNPVYESIVKFIVPEDKEFFYVIKNFNNPSYKPQITMEDGYKVYSFHQGESAPFISEPESPPIGSLLPSVYGSTYKDQSYLSEWLSKLFYERMVIDDNMKKMVKEILDKANATTEEEIVKALYRFTQEYIKYLSIKTSLSSGFSGHKAIETFYNRYGDCIDKSIFFATILREFGVESYPVIIMTNDEKQPLFGELGVVSGNHAINEIHFKESKKVIYLDTTSTTYRYPYFREDDHNITAWNPVLNQLNFIESPKPDDNFQIFSTKIVLQKDGSGQIYKNNIYSGSWEAGLREYLASLKDNEKRAIFGQLASKEYPGSILDSYAHSDPKDYKKPFELEFSFKAGEITKKSGRFLILSLPVRYNFSFVTFETRSSPINLRTNYGDKNITEIVIPKELKVKSKLEDIEIKNSFFRYKASYKVENDKLTIESSFFRYKAYIPKEDYEEFRKALFEVDKIVKRPIIFDGL